MNTTTEAPLRACDEHAPTPPRLQQHAATQLVGLYRDADYMATPERWDAAALLARAARFAHPRLLDGSLAGWLDTWETGERAPLACIDADDQHDTNRLARAVLAAHGHLTGPAVTTATGLDLAKGDMLIIGWDRVEIAELGYDGVLDAGMVADVAAVDPDAATFALEVGVAGVRVDLDAGGNLAGKLSYAYTETDAAAPMPSPARRRGWVLDHELGYELDDGADIDA